MIDDFFINQAEKLRDVLYFSNKETRKEQIILEQMRFEFMYEWSLHYKFGAKVSSLILIPLWLLK